MDDIQKKQSIDFVVDWFENEIQAAEMRCWDGLFEGALARKDFLNQMVVEYFKAILERNAEQRSMHSYCGEGNEARKQLIRNGREQLLKRRDADFCRLGLSDPLRERLWKREESRSSGQFGGYKLNAMEMAAFENCRRNTGLEIVKLFINGAVTDSNRSTGETISGAYNDYYAYLEKWNKLSDPTEWLYKLLDIYNLEKNMGVSMVFQLAQYMKQKGKDKVEQECLHELLCGIKAVPCVPLRCMRICKGICLGENCCLENRFLYARGNWFEFLFETSERMGRESERLNDLLCLKCHALGKAYADARLQEVASDVEHIMLQTYFRENYNLFEKFQPKERVEKLPAETIKLIRHVTKVMFGEKE